MNTSHRLCYSRASQRYMMRCNGKWTVLIQHLSSLYDHSKRFTLQLIHPFTHIHTLMAGATTQGAILLIRGNLTIHSHSNTVGTETGVISGSVSCPRTHRHVDRRSRESNRQCSNWRTTAEPQPPVTKIP